MIIVLFKGQYFIFIGIITQFSPSWSCLWDIHLANDQGISKKKRPQLEHYHYSLWKTHTIQNKVIKYDQEKVLWFVLEGFPHMLTRFSLFHTSTAVWIPFLSHTLTAFLLEVLKVAEESRRVISNCMFPQKLYHQLSVLAKLTAANQRHPNNITPVGASYYPIYPPS